jgi:hypothetical protein
MALRKEFGDTPNTKQKHDLELRFNRARKNSPAGARHSHRMAGANSGNARIEEARPDGRDA